MIASFAAILPEIALVAGAIVGLKELYKALNDEANPQSILGGEHAPTSGPFAYKNSPEYKQRVGEERNSQGARTNKRGEYEKGGVYAPPGGAVTRWSGLAQEASKKYGVPVSVILAQIEQESGGNPSASSSAGAKGVSQFIPGTAAEYGVKYGTTKADVESQIMGQAHYDANLGAAKDLRLALEKYNGAPGSAESTQYAASILAKLGNYRGYNTGKEGAFGGTGASTNAALEALQNETSNAKATKEAESEAKRAKEKGESKAEEAVKKAEDEAKRQLEKITTAGESLLKKYEAEIQNSTPSAMEKALGISTTGRFKSIPGMAEKAAGTGKLGGLEGELGKSAAASESGKQESKLVTELKATHQAGLVKLADEVAAAHKQALDVLAEEMVATEQLKLGESLKIQATLEKDRTTQLEHTASDQLNIVKAEQAQQTNAMKAAAAAIGDATQSMSDSFTALAQSIEDQSKVMSDSSNAVVEGIKDQTNIEVSILGERGLYGLNLIAQKEEVQLDEMKASYDQQVQQARIAEDNLTATWQGVMAQDQQIVDDDKTQADVQEAKAQAHSDAMTLLGAQNIAAAQAEVDAVQLAQDQKIGNAELKVLAAANGTKAQQTTAASGLSYAEHKGEAAEAEANAHLQQVQAGANAMAEQAARAMESVTNTWNEAIKNAEQAMAQAKGESAVALAKASQALQSIEDKAAQEEARVEKEVAVTKAKAQTQYAGSGLVVNQYGMEYGNADANASALGWELRSLIPL
jgi:hypothetical protein